MSSEAQTDPKRGARLRQANREQLAWRRIDLDGQLPEDHPARAILAVIDRLDLSKHRFGRQRAAGSGAKRAAEARLRRSEAALEQVPEVAPTKKKSGAKDTTPLR